MMQRKKLYGSDGNTATILSLSVHTGNSTAYTGDSPLSAQLTGTGLQLHR